MSIDELISKAVAAKPRQFITEEILRSVLIQESGDLKSTFVKTDPQYRANVSTAMKHLSKTEAQILELVTLPNRTIAKFRFEPGTYQKYPSVGWPARFYLSTSYGVGQVMGYNLVGKKPAKDAASICLGFAGREYEQVLRCCNSMEEGLRRAFNSPSVLKKDLKSLTYFAYCAYNGGQLITSKQDVLKRAKEVVSRLS